MVAQSKWIQNIMNLMFHFVHKIKYWRQITGNKLCKHEWCGGVRHMKRCTIRYSDDVCAIIMLWVKWRMTYYFVKVIFIGWGKLKPWLWLSLFFYKWKSHLQNRTWYVIFINNNAVIAHKSQMISALTSHDYFTHILMFCTQITSNYTHIIKKFKHHKIIAHTSQDTAHTSKGFAHHIILA